MAIGADFLIERSAVTVDVTVIAFKRGAIRHQPMGFERKSKLVVRIPAGGDSCQRGIRAAMFGVAGSAIQIHSAELHHAVQAGGVFELGGNVCMAGKTSVRHGVYFPWSGMTCAALFDLGVGGNPPERLAADGAQAAGREQFPVAGEGCPGDRRKGDDRDQ